MAAAERTFGIEFIINKEISIYGVPGETPEDPPFDPEAVKLQKAFNEILEKEKKEGRVSALSVGKKIEIDTTVQTRKEATVIGRRILRMSDSENSLALANRVFETINMSVVAPQRKQSVTKKSL